MSCTGRCPLQPYAAKPAGEASTISFRIRLFLCGLFAIPVSRNARLRRTEREYTSRLGCEACWRAHESRCAGEKAEDGRKLAPFFVFDCAACGVRSGSGRHETNRRVAGSGRCKARRGRQRCSATVGRASGEQSSRNWGQRRVSGRHPQCSCSHGRRTRCGCRLGRVATL